MNNCTNCGSGLVEAFYDGERGDPERCFSRCSICGNTGPRAKSPYHAQMAWNRANPSGKPSFLDRVKAFFTIRKCEQCGDNIGSNTNCPECIEFRDCTAI